MASAIKKRNPAAVIIFSFITFGIYAIYWIVKTKEEMKSLGADIPTAWLIIIPVANLYFIYKYVEGFSVYVKKDNNAIMWFLLYLFVAPLLIVVVQIELNKVAETASAPPAQQAPPPPQASPPPQTPPVPPEQNTQ